MTNDSTSFDPHARPVDDERLLNAVDGLDLRCSKALTEAGLSTFEEILIVQTAQGRKVSLVAVPDSSELKEINASGSLEIDRWLNLVAQTDMQIQFAAP